MKKLALITSLAAALTSANAYSNYEPYVGLDINSNRISHKGTGFINSNEYYEDSLTHLNYNIGVKRNNISFELGYFQDSGDKINNNTGLVYTSGPKTGQAVETKTSLDAKFLTADLGYELDTKTNKLALGGIIGATYADFSLTENFNDGTTIKSDATGLGLSLGGYIGYDINPHFRVLGRVKYTMFNDIKPSGSAGMSEINDMVTVGLGVRVSL